MQNVKPQKSKCKSYPRMTCYARKARFSDTFTFLLYHFAVLHLKNFAKSDAAKYSEN